MLVSALVTLTNYSKLGSMAHVVRSSLRHLKLSHTVYSRTKIFGEEPGFTTENLFLCCRHLCVKTGNEIPGSLSLLVSDFVLKRIYGESIPK
jgi:hypothetical protein